MRSAARRASFGSLSGRAGMSLLGVLLAVGVFWLVWIYGHALRDPRYLDGWLLAVGMGAQLYFHIALKKGRLSPRSAARWRAIHVFVGYVLIAVFISHCDFSLPDTALEWALWTGFVLVTLTGLLGTYLAWSLRARHGIDEHLNFDRIPMRRAELAQEVHDIVVESDPPPTLLPLPAPPHDAWVMDLYAAHLQRFLEAQRHVGAHLIGSGRPLKRILNEIDSLTRYVDQPGRDKLAAIRERVIEKDRLDLARVQLGLARGWLFVHVPVTYALIVLTVLHVLVVYAFSAGAF